MLKNTFYFISKALLVLKIFKFCPDFLDHVGKQFDKMVILKINDVTNCQQAITIHIFPNISRSKGNQTMKLGQLIEYNIT